MRVLPSARPGSLVPGLALLAAVVIGFGLIAGFFGARVQLFDTFAHFRAHAALALLLVALVLLWGRFWAAGLASIAAATLGLVSVYPYLVPEVAAKAAPNAPRYSLLQMNLRYDAPDPAAALRLVGALAPDVITVQEMTGEWKQALETLRGRYPYQYYCAYPDGDGDAALLSRRPFAEGDEDDESEGLCVPRAGFAAKRVDFNGSVVTIGSQHLRWPWPGRQWGQIERLVPVLAALPGPVLIAGDFNAAPWSASVATYAALSRTRIARGLGPTWIASPLPPDLARILGLPIDNVLASEGVRILGVEKPEATSSDHLPVLVTFTLPIAPATQPKVQTVAR